MSSHVPMGGDAGNLFGNQFEQQQYNPSVDDLPPLKPKVVEVPVQEYNAAHEKKKKKKQAALSDDDDDDDRDQEEVKKHKKSQDDDDDGEIDLIEKQEGEQDKSASDPSYGIQSLGSSGGIGTVQGDQDSKYVIADGVSKRKFTQASQKIFSKPSATTAKRADILAEKECEIMAEITTFVKAAHVTYTVKGFDRKGEFQVLRRYSQFHTLHNALSQRFPGIYIPPIPPKKAIGNTGIGFIIQRRFFLDRFLSLVCEIDHLAYSQEFTAFIRSNIDYDKSLNSMPKASYQYIEERYKSDLDIDPETEEDQITRYNDKIRNFANFIKKSQGFLEALKKQVKVMIPSKDSENANYGVFCKMLCKYEQTALTEYCNQSEGHYIIKGSDVEQEFQDLEKQLKNPFKEVYYWLKGECYDCYAILEMIKSRDKMIDLRLKAEKKKNDDRLNLQKLQAGKKSLKSIFSTKSNADQMNSMANNITKGEKDIQSLQGINTLTTIFIGKNIIPKLKRDKMQAYYKIIKKFSSIQSQQANILGDIWSKILQSTNLKHF